MVVPNIEMKYPDIAELVKQKKLLAEQDKLLQYISRHFISISKRDNKSYNKHWKCVVNMVEEKIKEDPSSPSFAAVYKEQHVSGSFWDGLKVGKPDEFDINFILRLPLKIKPLSAEYRSYVNIRAEEGEIEGLKKDPKQWKEFCKIEKWFDKSGFLKTDEIRSYMESVIDRALKTLHPHGNGYWSFKENNTTYKIKLQKNGPALTLNVSILPEEETFSIDLVPAFEFSGPLPWSPSRTRRCPQNEKSWYVVPKPLKRRDGTWIRPNESQKSPWRLSFHDQESELIRDTHHLKPVLKLLKKLRDNCELHGLASYYIKTVFLWEVEKNTREFWRKQLSYIFLYMLSKLVDVAEKRIPYFWDKKTLLLQNMKDGPFRNLVGKLKNLRAKIIHGLKENDRFAIARLLLTDDEFKELQSSYRCLP